MAVIGPRRRNVLAAVLLVAAILISTAVVSLGTARTTTLTKTTTTTLTTSAITSAGIRIYEVTFLQSRSCDFGQYFATWSVTLGDQRIMEPSNASAPISWNDTRLTNSTGSIAITFSVPNGVYQFSTLPNNDIFGLTPANGNVTVQDADVNIVLSDFSDVCYGRSG